MQNSGEEQATFIYIMADTLILLRKLCFNLLPMYISVEFNACSAKHNQKRTICLSLGNTLAGYFIFR